MNRIITGNQVIHVDKIKKDEVILARKDGKYVGFIRYSSVCQGFTLAFPNGLISGGSYNTIKQLIEDLQHEFEFYT